MYFQICDKRWLQPVIVCWTIPGQGCHNMALNCAVTTNEETHTKIGSLFRIVWPSQSTKFLSFCLLITWELRGSLHCTTSERASKDFHLLLISCSCMHDTYEMKVFVLKSRFGLCIYSFYFSCFALHLENKRLIFSFSLSYLWVQVSSLRGDCKSNGWITKSNSAPHVFLIICTFFLYDWFINLGLLLDDLLLVG